MFDIGFWELVIIAVMALVVVGPERLPLFLGKVGRWVGKARGYINAVRGDIDREIKKAERLAEQNESLLKLQEATKKAQQQAQEAERALNSPAAADKLMGNLSPTSTASGTTDSANAAGEAIARPLDTEAGATTTKTDQRQ